MPEFSKSDGFKMQMGSKQLDTDTSFNEKDKAIINAAPAVMQHNWGGESVEMKDQETPVKKDTALYAVQSGPIDGGAAYADTTTDSVAEAEKSSGMSDDEKGDLVGKALGKE